MTSLHLRVSQLPLELLWRAWVSGEGRGEGQKAWCRHSFSHFLLTSLQCFLLAAASPSGFDPDGLTVCAHASGHEHAHLHTPTQVWCSQCTWCSSAVAERRGGPSLMGRPQA